MGIRVSSEGQTDGRETQRASGEDARGPHGASRKETRAPTVRTLRRGESAPPLFCGVCHKSGSVPSAQWAHVGGFYCGGCRTCGTGFDIGPERSEEHTSELQSR